MKKFCRQRACGQRTDIFGEVKMERLRAQMRVGLLRLARGQVPLSSILTAQAVSFWNETLLNLSNLPNPEPSLAQTLALATTDPLLLK